MAPAAIRDKFSSIPSRARRYQLRNRAEGLCRGCAVPSGTRALCTDCTTKIIDYQRRKRKPIKKRRTGKARRGPARSAKYLAFIRTQACVCCGTKISVEAAHQGPHGLGQKATDFHALPACEECHRTGKRSYHVLGPVAWETYWNLDVPALIAKFNQWFLTERAA